MPIPTTAEAVAASVAVARHLGLPADDPLVVADGYSVRVLLRPAPVLTRVLTAGRLLRGNPLPWLTREVAVARWLHERGAAVGEPWAESGPHLVGEHPVTLWRWYGAGGEAVGQAAFGAMLGELHATLADYPAPLPPLVGPLTDIAAARTRSDDPVLHAAADTLVPIALAMPRRPLHGDAHTGNVLPTAGGPRWIDLEDVCAGPPEWDLSSRTVSAAAVAAYPGAVDADRLAVLRALRQLQTLAGVLTDDLQDPGLRGGLTDTLRHWA